MSTTAIASTKEMKRSNSFFLRAKKEVSEQGLAKTKKPFKRIRGLLKRESRKDRHAKKEEKNASGLAGNAARLASSSSVSRTDDDMETVYGVDIEGSVTSQVTPPPPRSNVPSLLPTTHSTEDEAAADVELFMPPSLIAPSLQVILLLMDPMSRRFELLQLEFDSNTAVVKDVLGQIPHSVTENALKQQSFAGIADRYGTELILSLRLSEFCKGSEILVAIPEGMAAKECARLSRPILNDEKVITMLRSSGIEASSFMESPVAIKSPSMLGEEPAISRNISPVSSPPPPQTEVATKSVFNRIFSMLLVGLLAFGVQVSHFYVSSPLERGQRLSPGSTITQCGLLFFLPQCENNPSLEMSMDGVMTMYGADKSIEWTMTGGVCASFDGGCMNGAILNEDGTLLIGGTPISTVFALGKATLSPWPFAEAPKVRVMRSKNL